MNASLRNLVKAATMIVVVACSAGDSLRPVDMPTDANLTLDGMATADRTGEYTSATDTSYGTISVGPNGGNWIFGEHKINFPANSVCDMSQTNYFEWGQACTPITSNVNISVKWWRDGQGHPHVDFSPALRFQPTKKGEVTLYLKDQAAAKATNPVIGYCAVLDQLCIDESLMDSALATKKDARGGFVYRIIRHFSGYNVWA